MEMVVTSRVIIEKGEGVRIFVFGGNLVYQMVFTKLHSPNCVTKLRFVGLPNVIYQIAWIVHQIENAEIYQMQWNAIT